MNNRNKAFPERLARAFSASVFRSLAARTAAEEVRSIITGAGTGGLGRRMRLSRLFDRAYDRLMESHRSEYLYKNTLTNSILLARHTLDDGPNAARLLTEFWAGDARVDLGVVNGTSTAYEVKSDLDRLDRLSNQLHWYSMVFDHIYVVTSDRMLPAIEKSLPSHVGVMVLTDSGVIEQRVPALSNKHRVDTRIVFRAMRQMEVLEFCCRRFGLDPNLSSGLRFDECWRVFRTLAPEEAHDAMVSMVRQRSIHGAQRALIRAAPVSLKHHAISRSMNIASYPLVIKSLETVI